MKRNIIILFVMSCAIAYGQSSTEKISRELGFEKKSSNNTLMIANINGNINVEGYAGDKIIVEVTKTIKAKTEQRLQRGKSELSVGVIDRADTIILYVDGLCSQFARNSKSRNGSRFAGWGYDWNGCDRDKDWHRDEGYDHKFDFRVKVPSTVNVIVSTINDGDVRVEKVEGQVKASNVNGAITLKDLSSATYAHTINGDVDLDFTRNPSKECSFYTLNGDINAFFQPGLAANIGFKSFNGDLFSNVAEMSELPPVLEKKDYKNGVKYKVNGNQFRIGKGGALLDFETFNGDVYVKEKK